MPAHNARMEMPGLPILMYHALPSGPRPEDRDAVPLSVFAVHMRALVDDGWRLEGVTDALRIRDSDASARVAAVTFDDGYVDLPEGVELLASLGGSCTAYVITDFTDDAASRRFVNWAQVCELQQAGVEIGSHSCSHPQLDIIPADAALRELCESRERIQSAVGAVVRSFSYPHGYCSRRLQRLAERAGYENACRIGRRVARADDRLALPRLQPRATTSAEALLDMIRNGEPGLAPRVKHLAGPAWRAARRTAALGDRIR